MVDESSRLGIKLPANPNQTKEDSIEKHKGIQETINELNTLSLNKNQTTKRLIVFYLIVCDYRS